MFTGSAGTVTVDGDISFQGLQFSTTGYTLTGGTLTMTGDPVGNPAASFVNVDGGVTTTIASTLAGTGGLEKLGAGTLTLTGANTYTGGTMIAAGTLQLGNGGTTGSILGDVADNGVLAFNRTDAVQFAGTISGSGAVQQLGTGTLMLSGANTYTGPTTVNAGMLSVNGSIASSSLTTVNPGGTLGGNGTVGDTTIAGGTLAPGNSIGTLTVAGDLVFGAGLEICGRSLAGRRRPHQRLGNRDSVRRNRRRDLPAGNLRRQGLHRSSMRRAALPAPRLPGSTRLRCPA